MAQERWLEVKRVLETCVEFRGERRIPNHRSAAGRQRWTRTNVSETK